MTESFISKDKTGQISIIIPPNEAAMIVVTPANGTIKYDKNKMLIDDVIVDYAQHKVAYTFSPRIKALEAKSYLIEKGKTTTIYCTVEDLDSDILDYEWTTDQGVISGDKSEIIWTAPTTLGASEIKVIVKDDDGNLDSLNISIEVVDLINLAPMIEEISTPKRYADISETIHIRCDANDPNGDMLSYQWSTNGGQIIGTGNDIQWSAPTQEGIFTIDIKVDDGKGLSDQGQISILVKSFDDQGEIIAYYPFNGSANDKSGNEHHGTAKGAILTADFDGKPLSSYYFNGGSQHIEVANTPKLNFQDGITLSLWCKPIPSPEKETFLLSHGSWQNRYKLSITPTGYLRWTVNTLTRIVDLDSDLIIQKDSIYHIVASYDGASMMIFINGHLNTFKIQNGNIRTTSLPLLIGQILPSDANYNYKGIMDEIKIYDYAIHPEDVTKLYIISATKNLAFPASITLYPNPVHQHIHLIGDENMEQFSILDLQGTKVIEHIFQDKTQPSIDVSSLVNGTYVLLIRNHQREIIKRIQFIKS